MEQMILDNHAIVNGKHWIGTSFEGGGCWVELPDNEVDSFKIITIPQYGGQPTVQTNANTLAEAMRQAEEYSI